MQDKKTIKDDIFNKVWAACNTFRGVIDPNQYKDYVLSMLFVKYLSDVRKDKIAEFKDKYDIPTTCEDCKYEQKGDQKPTTTCKSCEGKWERVERAMKNERFIIPESATFEQLYNNRTKSNIGEIIDIALDAIEEDNRKKLQDVFQDIRFNSRTLGDDIERQRRLQNLLNDFVSLDLRPSVLGEGDVIGDVYEYLIGSFAGDAGKKAGEFYTPPQVASLLAKLVQPQSGHRIYDPTCGSGSLLIKAGKEVGSNNFSLYGQEVNSSTYALCRMNMYLHEMDKANIAKGDTINSPRHLENDNLMKFDIVVANPPFSLSKWAGDKVLAGDEPYKRFERGTPPSSKGDFAFILHMIASTYENTGKVGVVVPHGVLFRGSSEGRIREALIDDNLLEAVIGLPANLFFGTGIPACILIYNRGKKTDDVLFIDASREHGTQKTQNVLTDENLDKIFKTYIDFKTIDKYSYRATVAEIQENDYNLNIPRYVDTFEPEAPIDITAVQTEIKTLDEELNTVKNEMSDYLKTLGF
jgi:type I restriction enzyme M protein